MATRSARFPKTPDVNIRFFLLLYLLMLVYGTLYPLRGWTVPEGGFFQHFLEANLANLSMTDMITNVLVYIPAGLLWAPFFARQISWSASVVLACLMGTGLSFGLEAAQVFVPGRNSALSDLLLNGIGTAMGGVAALMMSGRTRSGMRLRNFRHDTFEHGTLPTIGLTVLGLWVLSQLSPLVPSLSISNLRDGLKPIWYSVTGQSSFITMQSLGYFCSVFALGGIFLSLSRSRRTGLLLFGLMLMMVLLMKIPVLSRQLSLEAFLGCAGALIVLSLLHQVSARVILSCAGCFILTGYALDALQPSTVSAQTIAFNWIPFKGHMQNIVGLANILASGWVFLGLGYVIRSLCPASMVVAAGVTGVLFVAGLTALMEILQLNIPGRVPDVTDVLIAVVAWCCAWIGETTTSQTTSNGESTIARSNMSQYLP